jgi:hypothetical protein
MRATPSTARRPAAGDAVEAAGGFWRAGRILRLQSGSRACRVGAAPPPNPDRNGDTLVGRGIATRSARVPLVITGVRICERFAEYVCETGSGTRGLVA